MLVEKNIDGAEDEVQIGLHKDPEHTELNALQVSMDLLDLGHKTLSVTLTVYAKCDTYCTQPNSNHASALVMLPTRCVLNWRICIRPLGALKHIDISKCYAAPNAVDTSPVKMRHVIPWPPTQTQMSLVCSGYRHHAPHMHITAHCCDM